MKREKKIELNKNKIENQFEDKKNDNTDEDCIVSDEFKESDRIVPNKDYNNDEKDLLELRNIAIEKHNEFRKKHGAEYLELNIELCEIAQERAEKYSETDIEKMYMIPPKLYKGDIVGENIAIIENYDKINIEDIINKWYEEKINYEFDSNKYIENTGHFTQLIWKGTKKVGFGHKKSNNGKMYFIAIYYPAGNIFKQFKNNVLKE